LPFPCFSRCIRCWKRLSELRERAGFCYDISMLDVLTLRPIAFGMDVSDSSLKLVQLRRCGRELDIASFGEELLSPGIVDKGEIKDEKALAKAMHQFLSRVKGERLKTDRVVASLPEEKAFLKVIQLPKMTVEELAKVISFEAENHIPFSAKECYLDFELIDPVVNHLDHLDVLLVACPRQVVDSYLRVFKMAGLKPMALETESLAISRSLVKNWLSSVPVLLIDLGSVRTSLVIFSGRSIRFTSSLPFSSAQITQTLAGGLQLSWEQAEKFKTDYGLVGQPEVKLQEKTGDSEPEREIFGDSQVLRILSPLLSDWVSEIRNFLDFYYSHAGHEHLPLTGSEVRRIILSGGGANLKGLDRFLSKELNLPVVLGNPWVNILADPSLRVPEDYLRRSLSYATVLGLALRGVLSDVNFS